MADPIESPESFANLLASKCYANRWHQFDAAAAIRERDASVREPLERRIAELEDLAYVGRHHFPDLTYKARLEELVPKFRERSERLASLETQLDEMRLRLHGQADRIASLEAALHSAERLADARYITVEELEDKLDEAKAQLASALPWVRAGIDYESTEREARALVTSIEKLLPPPASQKEPHAR